MRRMPPRAGAARLVSDESPPYHIHDTLETRSDAHTAHTHVRGTLYTCS